MLWDYKWEGKTCWGFWYFCLTVFALLWSTINSLAIVENGNVSHLNKNYQHLHFPNCQYTWIHSISTMLIYPFIAWFFTLNLYFRERYKLYHRLMTPWLKQSLVIQRVWITLLSGTLECFYSQEWGVGIHHNNIWIVGEIYVLFKVGEIWL